MLIYHLILFFLNILLTQSLMACMPITQKNLRLETMISCQLERSYYISNDVFAQQNYIFVFFHGLENEGRLSDLTMSKMHEMADIIKKNNGILVVPIGLEGAFPQSHSSLAWNPGFAEENDTFLFDLIDKIKKQSHIKSIYLGGFSNGAFYLSVFIRNTSKYPFKGFWLQGGGESFDENILIDPNVKIILEIGLEDHYHIKSLKDLHKKLKKQMPNESNHLLYRELETDHSLNLSYFNQDLQFLLDNQECMIE